MLLVVHYRVMEHLGSLESTQEARVALGYASGNSYASFVLCKLPACSITRWCTLKHEPIVKYNIFSIDLTSNVHSKCTFRPVAVSVNCFKIQDMAVKTRKIFAVYERRDIFVDANIVSEDWSCDVHPYGRISERHFENFIRTEDNLWLFIIYGNTQDIC